jgi:hypothetical protein
VIAGTALALVLLSLSARFARSQEYMLNRDFFVFWLSAKMMWLGEDFYNTEVWVSYHSFYGAEHLSYPAYPYPYPLVLLFAPLGLLTLQHAATVWIFLTIIMILISVFLLLKTWRTVTVWPYALPILAGIFLFRPVFGILVWGQLDGLLLLILAVVVYLWERGKWIVGSLFLPLLLLKPQFGVPIVGLVGFWLVARRKWQALFWSGVAALMIFGAGWLADPTWVGRWLSAIQGKWTTILDYPSIWGLTSWLCRYQQGCYLSVGTLASLIAILSALAVCVIDKDARPSLVIALFVCIALLVTPYVQIYDHVLITLPVLAIMEMMVIGKLPYLITSTFFLVISILAFALAFVYAGIGIDIWSAVIPLIVLIVLWASYVKLRYLSEVRWK